MVESSIKLVGLTADLQDRRDAYQRKVGEALAVSRHKGEVETELEHLSDEIETLGKALGVLHTLSTSIQEHFLKGIESLVSEGLSAVFEETIKFHITATTRNKQVNLDFTLENKDGTETDLLDARGGGLVSLCGVLLRVIMCRLMSDRVRQVLVLDEALGMLSSNYQQSAGELLDKLSKELDMQIMLVSHNNEIAETADRLYELRRDGNSVIAEKLR